MKCIVGCFLIAITFCIQFVPIDSSYGDRSVLYMSCLNYCLHQNCTKDGTMFKNSVAANQQEFWCQMLQWTCQEECRYHCMWQTVEQFKITGDSTPKFHGRWPFTRVLGMQEPASVFASLLNLAANCHMYLKVRREFPLWRPHTMPITVFWHGFAIVCMNAWVWSTVFHTRDTPFTEFMDYACALSMVMGLFVAAIVRVLYKRTALTMCALAVPLFFFAAHVRYLYTGLVNYDYNMQLNVFFGVSGSAVWLCVSWRQHRAGRRYARRVAAFTALSGAALALELLDFPPLGRAWDAHALWHLATAPLPLLFYQYVIEDLRYLQSRELHKCALKLT